MMVQPALVGLGYALAASIVVAFLVAARRLDRRLAIALSLLAIAIPGLLLGGLPDPAAPLQQIVYGAVRGSINVAPVIGLGLLIITVIAVGRAFCGYACPLGAVQEVLSRAVPPKIRVDAGVASYFRGAVLVIFLAAGAAVVVYPRLNPFGVFSLHPGILPAAVFLGIAASSLFVYRPWCRLLCPFGAIAGIASRLSLFRLKADGRCNDCGRCDRVCPAGQSIRAGKLADCYYCGRCVAACGKQAITGKLRLAEGRRPAEEATVK